MKNKALLQPLALHDLQLKNRVVMAPLTRNRADNQEHNVTDLHVTYYTQRASAGLIITEGTVVSKEAVGYINVPGLYTETQVEAWKKVTAAVHAKGGLIFAQLWHVGRVSHPDLLDGQLPLGPSALNPYTKAYTFDGYMDTPTAREMTLEDIRRTIQDFKNAAANAVKAGFDGVELHAANGYLLHQFFNLYSNHRTDIYGGSIENRARILFDIIEELKEVIDLGRVGVRLNPSLHQALGMNLDEESGKVHDYIVQRLNDYQIAYVHLIEPITKVDDIPYAIVEVTKHFRPMYQGVMITNRRYTPETGNQMIEDGYADLVSFGVPFIANPDLVQRIEKDLPLSKPDESTFYTPGPKGYTDYPNYEATSAQ